MKSNYNMRETVPTVLRDGLLIALTLQAAAAFGQLSITSITVPGAASLAVSSLNATGQVSGYYFTESAAQRAFFWSDGIGVDLGTLGGGTAVGNAMNNLGAVVGYASLAGEAEYHAFLYSGGVMLGLGSFGGTISSAAAINDAGQITGYAYVSPFNLDYHAFRWNGSAMQDLGTLGGTLSYGTAINGRGQVAGDSTRAGNWENHAFLYSDGVMRDLGTLGGSFSSAFALNERGHVAGESATLFDQETRAFLFDGTSLRNLGTLGGTFSAGYGVNDLGQVIGDSYLAGNVENRGFIFQNGLMQNLGTLGGGYSSAWAINNLGQIVGVSSNSLGQQRAFLWQNGAMTDLNTLLPANSGWELAGAYLINDLGYVVGDGLYQGQYRWFLLSPAKEENHLPIADAGADVVAECNSGTAVVNLEGSASSDPDGDALDYEWLESGVLLGRGISLNVTLPSGSHALILRVTDAHGASSEDNLMVSVVDSTAPAVLCPMGTFASADGTGVARIPDVLASLVASDSCSTSANLARSQSPLAGTVVGLGAHAILVTVVDGAGHQVSCTTTFTVTDVTPPTVQCPENNTASADEQGVAVVPDLLSGLVASDNCTAALALGKEQSPVAGTTLGLGTHAITVTVADAAGNRATCSGTFTVVDVTSPVVETPAEVTCRTGTDCQAVVPDLSLRTRATDNCTPVNELVFIQEPAAGTLVDRGSHPIRVTVTDLAGNATTRIVMLHAVDQTPPEIVSLVATPAQIAPANRKMVSVSVSATATDNCDPSPVTRIVSVASNEPTTSANDNTGPDWVITGDLTLQVRAEVASDTEARIYTIRVSSTDASGNVDYSNVQVKVPTKGRKASDFTVAKDSGKEKK